MSLHSLGFGRFRNGIFSNRNRNRNNSTRLKARLYGALILPIAVYGAEAWMVRSQKIKTLEVFEMRCLHSIRGVTRVDRLQNIKIREDTFTPESIMSSDREYWAVWPCFPYAKR